MDCRNFLDHNKKLFCCQTKLPELGLIDAKKLFCSQGEKQPFAHVCSLNYKFYFCPQSIDLGLTSFIKLLHCKMLPFFTLHRFLLCITVRNQ